MRRLLFLLILISSLRADTSNLIILDGGETHVKLTHNTSYFLDKTSQLNQYTIQSSDINFTQSTKESISLGHQYTSNLWVTFSIKNNSNTDKN